MSACNSVDTLSGSSYNLTVFCLSEISVLFEVSKVILTKVYKARSITVHLVSSPPVDNLLIRESVDLSNC